jgi:hypothetical protein
MRWLLALIVIGCSGSTLRRDLLDGGSDAGGTTLEGWVVDVTTDAGMAGAQVSVGVAQVATGPDGAFVAPVLEPGLQAVEVHATGYWTGVYMVQILPGPNLVLLQMERDCTKLRCPAGFYCGLTSCAAGTGAASIVGHITDVCDSSDRLALVEVIDVYGTTGSCTDGSGRFRIDGRLGGESVSVKVSSPGFTSWELPLYLKAGDNDFSTSLSRSCSTAAPAQQCR